MSAPIEKARNERWTRHLSYCRTRITEPPPPIVSGKLTRMVGLTLEAIGCQAPIGGRCVVIGHNNIPVEAEVVGFSGDKVFLMPTGDIRGLVPNAQVIPSGQVYEAVVGDALLGRVVDGAGKPLDGKGPLRAADSLPITGLPINPLSRRAIKTPLDVGVRAINALLTIGRGQRMGLFSGSGVGKSVLLGMMTRYTNADVIVVGLIGERGREVKEFIDNILGAEGLKRSVVVATPADHPPLLRLHGGMLATSIAEYFRDKGKHVLLLMDSLTRYAQAQREIGLAIGEPPATKGYPPSAFARLPQLVERAGNGDARGGSITGIYTVLAEGDDQQDPIADAARAVLDGHIVLSRRLADSGHFPAIDIEASISRSMAHITGKEHQQLAQQFKQIYSMYESNRDLITVGAYAKGSDVRIDEAIAMHPAMMRLLKQDMNEPVTYQESINQVATLLKSQTGTELVQEEEAGVIKETR